MTSPSKNEIDLLELVRDGRHFAEKRGDRIHIIDSLTGNTKIIYSDPGTSQVPTEFVESQLPNGSTVFVQTGVNPVAGGVREITYSPITVDLICQKVAEGGSLTRICGQPGFPSYTAFCRWRRQHPWIDEQLTLARRDRAEYLRDKAVGEADKAEGRDPISGSQLRVDTYKWAASVDNEKYNPKAKVEATLVAPTQIIVHTGIDRGEPQKDVTPEPKQVEE